MKIFRWLTNNILFVLTLFLLMFIPLYPKVPLLDVINTWVYIRVEDFVVLLVLIVWLILLLREKITLRTPLTLPIMIFWIIGAIATIHGVLLIFPSTSNVFPNVAFLSMLRRIEYLSLFFVAFAGMKNKRFLSYVVVVLVITLLVVVGYGIGQKYFGFPAFLTMNEEFAKGVPIRLSALSRVPSTFGGHYDLAAYLVLIIPILTSMIFAFKKRLVKLLLLTTVGAGFVVLFMTVSRISFFVLLISVAGVLLFQKKRLIAFTLPILAAIAILLLMFSPSLLQRFGNTVKEVDVLVDIKTGEAIGNVKEVSSKNFENKIIKRKAIRDKDELYWGIRNKGEDSTLATPSARVSFFTLPPQVVLFIPPNTSTGESLPQGTAYVNLSLSPVIKRTGEIFYERLSKDKEATDSADVLMFSGDFLIKRATAYDLSFTTRFQGEWPNAIAAFKKNILFGSGYSSTSLAVDNNYLRILGEVGLLGFISFFAIFIIAGIYIVKVLPEIDSLVARSFILGFAAGVVGLMLNAIFIDVFEASKIAYLLWLLTGITLGIAHFYQKKYIDLFGEFKKIMSSPYAIIVYLSIIVVIIFSPLLSNYFVGDDFTWFRWTAENSSIWRYFTDADGFFYRPGTKLYFLLMYSVFWLNQTVYHLVSIFLHFVVAVLLFLLARKILRDLLLSAATALLFFIISGYSEAVFWVSSTGFLFTAVFTLLSLLFFITWEENKKNIYFVASLASFIFSLLFHELGIVTPLLVILYKFTFASERPALGTIFKEIHYRVLFIPILVYIAIRFLAHSHWFSGDYSYNLLKLPVNIVGNIIGYLSLAFFGSASLPFYQALRNFSKQHILFSIFIAVMVAYVAILLYKKIITKMEQRERKIVIFGLLFFILALLPFLGLGNITSRYSYLSSVGFVLVFAFLIKKLYNHLLSQGRDIALAVMVVVVSLFSLLHVIQLQQIHSNWYEAGKKVNTFFVAIDALYTDYWAKEPVEFHFVNVPTRVGEAWVFPVGLDSALWLTFRNPKIRVYKWQSVKQAFDAVTLSPNQKVLEFDASGRVFERKKTLSVQ